METFLHMYSLYAVSAQKVCNFKSYHLFFCQYLKKIKCQVHKNQFFKDFLRSQELPRHIRTCSSNQTTHYSQKHWLLQYEHHLQSVIEVSFSKPNTESKQFLKQESSVLQ